ncbi:MAG: amidohydrolase [Bacteroidetes bacterium]|nr:amidohydrolase [Bacteroidota bacterium]
MHAPLESPTATAEPHTDAQLQTMLTGLRRHLHQYPEVGFEEIETSKYIRNWLALQGFTTHGPIAKTGFYVEVSGPHPGPTIGYRADMDALPTQDGKEVEYASKNDGVAHLCGHDAHMAVACGVATLLGEQRDRLHGTVRVFFQPNEESNPSGAPVMISEGILDGLESVYAIHMDPTIAVGCFGLRDGALTAGCSTFRVKVIAGQAGHSARPHETVDTVWLATQILHQFYQLVGRITDSRLTAIITATRFNAGEAYNVIPMTVEFGGTLRCTDTQTLASLRDEMRRVAGSMGALYGADVDIDYGTPLPPVVNTPGETKTIREVISACCGDEMIRDIPLPSLGGEDFAFYLEELPGAMVRIGSAGGPESRYPLHHDRFDIDEAAMPGAARLMTEVLIRDLEKRAA